MPSTLQLSLTVEIIWRGFTFFNWTQELIFRALPGERGVHQISRRIVIRPQAYPLFAVYETDPDPIGPRVPVHLDPREPLDLQPRERLVSDHRYRNEIDV